MPKLSPGLGAGGEPAAEKSLSSKTLGCATVARLIGANPSGTATFMRSWLLIEQPGPWPDDALEQVLAEAFPPERLELLRALGDSAGLRPLLIRRPGRHVREQSRARRAVYVGSGDPDNRWLERFEIDDLTELAGLDLAALARGERGFGEPVTGPMFLVCTHGTKDMCCAVLGRPLATALHANQADRTWEVSHVGGDRWAGILLVVPDGYMHGHLDPQEANQVAKAARVRQVEPDHLRGRTSTESSWSQHAEIAVRQTFGARGLDEVLAVHERPAPTGPDAEVASDAETWVVRVRYGHRLLDVTVRHQAGHRQSAGRCGLFTPAGYVTESIRQVAAISV